MNRLEILNRSIRTYLAMYDQSKDESHLKAAKKSMKRYDEILKEVTSKTTSKQLRGENYEENKFNIDNTTKFRICKL